MTFTAYQLEKGFASSLRPALPCQSQKQNKDPMNKDPMKQDLPGSIKRDQVPQEEHCICMLFSYRHLYNYILLFVHSSDISC